MSGEAFFGRIGENLESAFADRMAEVRREGLSAPLTVIVGSNVLGAYLRSTLARRTGGFLNVRFVTFADLASLIARGGGVFETAAPPFADLVITSELAATGRFASFFGEAARTRGFAGALVSTCSDLAEGGCTPEVARRILDERQATGRLTAKTAAVLSLYIRFRERIEALGGDIHSRFNAALTRPLPLSLGRHFFAYGFYDFNEMQRRLLARLASERDAAVFMPWGEGEPFRFSARGWGMLERSGFATRGFGEAQAAVRRAPRPRILNVPGEEEEVREIARRILALAAKGGLRFGDMAVILPSAGSYAPLCREVFDEAGIPYHLRAGLPPAGGAAARGALGLIRLLSGGMRRGDLVEFLASAPIRRRGEEGLACDLLSLWIRKSAEAGCAGERGWIEESAAFVERMRFDVERGAERADALAAALEAQSLIADLARGAADVPEKVGWRDFADATIALVRSLFVESADTEIVCDRIGGLSALDGLGVPATFESFSHIAETALEEPGRPAGRICGEGVNILPLALARALSFEAVFMPGLAERVFPAVIRQDPFLGDKDRRELNAVARGAVHLTEKSERLSEEALLFALARGVARSELVLSYPRFEEGTGRERIHSSFFRFIEGFSIDGEHGDGYDLERVPRGAPLARGAELLGPHELDFERARVHREGGDGALPDNPFFARGARLVRGRWGSRKFTPYDGVFSSAEARGELRAMLEGDGRRFSPTSLETYAGCPFDFFLTRVLRVEVIEEPDRVISLGPIERGDLIHQILAAIFGELKERGLLPLRDAPAVEVLAVADPIIDRFLEDFPGTASVGVAVFWDMEKRLVRESIRLFLEEERREADGFVPEHFERSFGRRRDRLDIPYECGGRTLLFQGRIDRIDIAPGGRFRVIDYKTGRLVGKDQDFARGSALQLPVYLIAAARFLGLDLRSGEARYRRVGTGGERKVVTFAGGAWDAGEGEFPAIVGTITDGIEKGIFFAPAGEQGCRGCDVGIACPAGTSRLFTIKAAADERARAYVAMRGGEETEE